MTEKQIDVTELMQNIRVICQERVLDESSVVSAIEEALAMTLKRHRRSEERDYRVELDEKNALIRAYRRWQVLDDDDEDNPMTSPSHQVLLAVARERDPDLRPGDFVEEEMPREEVAQRLSAQMARQLIQQRLRDVERNRVLEEFLERQEDLVHATVRKLDHKSGDAICESHGVECILRKEDQIPRESLRPGDRIRAIVKEINREGRVPRLYITRVSVDFLKKLFEREVPEIENGVLQIMNAVREPGHRAKVAVRSTDPKVDPVGTCVGIRGSRVQSVTNEINGERIDIIEWQEKPENYVMKAVSPAEVSKIHIDDESRHITLIVDDDKISSAIGRNGSNVRLASELTGWKLSVSTEEKAEEVKREAMGKISQMFVERLDIDQTAAETLYEEGFDTIEDVALISRDEMLEIEAFSEDVVDKLQKRAKRAMEEDEAKIADRMKDVDPRLRELGGMDDGLLRQLVRENILTLEDLGDLARDELQEITNIQDEDRLDGLIMAAREPMFEE